jgi:hypothetical protein
VTHKLIIVLFVVATALLSKMQVSNAQSPYSYPWCAIYLGGTGSPAITRVGSNAEQQCSASAEIAS